MLEGKRFHVAGLGMIFWGISIKFSKWLFISNMLIFGLCITVSSISEHTLSNPEFHKFLVFENFEATMKLFISEHKLVRKLKKTREHTLTIEKNILNNILTPVATTSQYYTIGLRKRVVQYRRQYLLLLLSKTTKNKFFDLEYNFNNTRKEVMEGALKGILTLQETYDQNITAFSSGTVEWIGYKTSGSRITDKLVADDLASMSILAFTLFEWYDASVIYIHEAIRKLKELEDIRKVYLLRAFDSTLHQMMYKYMSYNTPSIHPNNTNHDMRKKHVQSDITKGKYNTPLSHALTYLRLSFMLYLYRSSSLFKYIFICIIIHFGLLNC